MTWSKSFSVVSLVIFKNSELAKMHVAQEYSDRFMVLLLWKSDLKSVYLKCWTKHKYLKLNNIIKMNRIIDIWLGS